MKIIQFCTILLILFIPFIALADNNVDKCKNLLTNLRNCQPYNCERVNTDNFLVTYLIIGRIPKNNYCFAMESMQGQKVFACKYDDETLKAAADMLENSFNNITTIDDNNKILIQKAWENGLCGIYDQQAIERNN